MERGPKDKLGGLSLDKNAQTFGHETLLDLDLKVAVLTWPNEIYYSGYFLVLKYTG